MRHYKTLSRSILIFTLAAFLCGCQKTPQSVEERMKNYGENNQLSNIELEYCTVEELKDMNLSKLNVELDNMVLPQDIDFSGITDLAVLEMSLEENGLQNQDTYLSLFSLDENYTINESLRESQGIIEYESTEDKEYLAVGENGFVSYFSGQDYDFCEGEAQLTGTLEKYDLDMDDISNKEIPAADGQKGLFEYQEMMRQWLEDKFPEEPFEYRISDIYVRELEHKGKSQKQLSFLAELSYGGVSLNSYGFKFIGSQEYLTNYGFNINCDSSGQVTFFSSGDGRMHFKSARELTNIVDLKSAISLVNTEMSGFNQLEIHKLIVQYALYPRYGTENEPYGTPGQKVEGRPCYTFLIKAEEEDNTMFGVNKSNSYQFIMVDMVTGELITNME